jgi:hypothetical protein
MRSAAVAVLATAVAATFAVLYATREPATKVVVRQPCGDRSYGHLASLRQAGGGWRLRFDPAWFTSGVTANTAAAQDGAVEPGQPVPNDNYVVDESHRLYVYRVAPDARVTVLTNNRTGILSTPIGLAELAQIVSTGRSPRRKLFEPLDSGVWIRVHIDTVCSIEQQYRP